MKRFLVTEEERKEILNLYSKKGLISEQNNTTNSDQVPYEIYRFAGWKIRVQGDTIDFLNREYEVIVSYNGNLSNIQYDVLNQQFTNTDMLLSTKEPIYNANPKIQEGDTPSKERLLSSILNYVRADKNESRPNERKALAFAVGLSDNKTPMFIGIYPELPNHREGVKIQGKSRKTIVQTPIIGFENMYIPQDRDSFNDIKWFVDLINPEYTYKDFKTQYGISLNYGTPYSPAYETVTNDTTTKTTEEKEEFIPLQIGDAISEPFNYDSATLTNEGNRLLSNFAKQFTDKKTSSPKLYQDYLNSLYEKTIEVKAYASIDGNSKEIMKGGYTSCNKENQTREAYNQCLSQAEAQNVVNELKKLLPDFFNETYKITFKPIGVGETTKFVNKTYLNSKSPDETLPNRRYEVVFPSFEKTYQK